MVEQSELFGESMGAGQDERTIHSVYVSSRMWERSYVSSGLSRFTEVLLLK